MKISVRNGKAELVKEDTLIQGSDRSYLAEFEFDESWDGYDKTAIFEAGAVMRIVQLVNDSCDIPSECFEKAGFVLKIGVYGTKNNYQTDTYWCHTNRILYEVDIDDIPPSKSELPETDVNDNGKILKVVNGRWNKVTPSGTSENAFVFNVTQNSNGNINCDATPSEIYDNFESGKIVFCRLYMAVADTYITSPNVGVSKNGDNYQVYAEHYMRDSASTSAIMILIMNMNSSGTPTISVETHHFID